MKRISLLLAALVLAACTTTGTIAPDPYNNTIAGVTAIRQGYTAALQAGKITLAQDQAMQAKLDGIRAGVVSAQALSISNPTQAATDLATQKAALAAVQPAPGVK